MSLVVSGVFAGTVFDLIINLKGLINRLAKIEAGPLNVSWPSTAKGQRINLYGSAF